MLEAHRIGNMRFEMARLPQHVSLKQPFSIPSLEEMEVFFDDFAKQMKSVKIQFEELTVAPNNIIGGIQSGCVSIRVKKALEMEALQKQLFQRLEDRFGPCPAAFDDDYIFYMTIAIGGGSFENYQKAYDILSKQNYNKSFVFNKLGLFIMMITILFREHTSATK